MLGSSLMGPLVNKIVRSISYVEGIEVLYRTNTIHISGEALLLNLPKLLLPQRLRDISSVEIVWPLRLREDMRGGRDPSLAVDKEHLRTIVSILSSDLPNLSRPHLALKTDKEYGLITESVDLEPMLAILDEFARHKSGLELFIVSLSRSAFRKLFPPKRGSKGMELPFQTSEFWRNLNGGFVPAPPLPIYGHYPKPPPRAAGIGSEITGTYGYWIIQGDTDDEAPITMAHCFGA